MATKIPVVKLSNGVEMPEIGFGVAALGNGAEFRGALESAVETGFRMFDTAPFYGNEAETGDVLRHCGVPREELFITTKLGNALQAYDDTMRAYDAALKNMGLDYLDLFLIHFPAPALNKYHEAWRAMEKIYEEGRVRAIGVSNFQETHLEKIFQTGHIVPHANELECNPYLTVRPLTNFCRDHGIRVINWFPLGGPSNPLIPYPGGQNNNLLTDPVMVELANKYGKSPAQVALRWATQNDITPIPKSSNPGRIQQNADIFDFTMSAEDLAKIDALNCDRRFGPDPNTFNDLKMG